MLTVRRGPVIDAVSSQQPRTHRFLLPLIAPLQRSATQADPCDPTTSRLNPSVVADILKTSLQMTTRLTPAFTYSEDLWWSGRT